MKPGVAYSCIFSYRRAIPQNISIVAYRILHWLLQPEACIILVPFFRSKMDLFRPKNDKTLPSPAKICKSPIRQELGLKDHVAIL